MESPSRPPSPLRAALAVALVVAAVYAPLARNGFVWDDATLVANPDVLGGSAGLLRALGSDLYGSGTATGPSGYWRPVATASYWLNARLGGDAFALHVGNVALHAATAGLLVLLLARVLAPAATLAAALAALAWAFHPQQVEAVAWISCRYELLTGLAAVAYLLLPKTAGARPALACGAVFLAGLLSKESFAGFAAVVLAEDWSARRTWRDCWPRWAAVALALATWGVARAALGVASLGGSGETVAAAPARLLAAVGTYAVRTVAPLPLTIHRPFEPQAWSIAAGALVLVALGVAAWRRRSLAIPAALFVGTLLPTSVAMGRLGIAAERYFYLPSLAIAWLAAAALAAAQRHRLRAVSAGSAVAFAVVVAALLPFTIGRLPEWRDDDTLFGAALRVDPGDPYAHMHFGVKASSEGRLDEARRHLELVASRAPGLAEGGAALADVLLRQGDAAGAIVHAQRAVEHDPRLTHGWIQLSWACHLAGDHRCELRAAERAAALSPDFVPGRVTAVLARCEVDAQPSCERDLETMAREGLLDPGTELVARATAALRRHDGAAASERIERLRRTMPGHPQLQHLEAQLAAIGGG